MTIAQRETPSTRTLSLPILGSGDAPSYPDSTGAHPPYKERAAQVDADALAEELRARVRGEVRFDPGSRALYATDASNYRQPPIGVVIPRDPEDVVAAVETVRHYG